MSDKVTKLDLESYLFGHPQPAAVDLEAAVLGAIMLDKDAYTIVRGIVGPEQMYDDRHRMIMHCFDRLDLEESVIDLLTVTEKAKQLGFIDKIGGAYYLVELTGRVGSSANIEHHARVVREEWMKRKLAKMSMGVIKSCYEKRDVFKILGEIDEDLLKIGNFTESGEVSLAQATKEANEAALKRKERGSEMVGEPLFGVGSLDRAIGGCEPGDVIDIFGSPGEGKTSLVTSILTNCINTKTRCWFWTPETHVTRISEKVSAHEIGMPTKAIRMGEHLNDAEKLRKIENSDRSYVILRNSPIDIPTMRRRVRLEHQLYGTRIFVFDRLELFNEARGSNSDIPKAVTDITSEMRALATEYGLIFVPLSQMKQEYMGQRPRLVGVYGGTLIQGNLTKALGVFQPARHGIKELESGMDSRGMGEVHVVKNSYGNEDTVELNFDGPTQKWFSRDEELDIIGENSDTPFG